MFQMINFVVEIAKTVDVSPEGNRIAAAGFGFDAITYFDFLRFTDANDFRLHAEDVMEFRVRVLFHA